MHMRVRDLIGEKLLKHICKNILETGKPSKTTDKQISDYVLKRGKHKPRGIINAESVNQKLSKITFSPFVRDKEERIRLFQSAYESIIREHRIKISDSYAIKCLLSKVKPESTQHKMRIKMYYSSLTEYDGIGIEVNVEGRGA